MFLPDIPREWDSDANTYTEVGVNQTLWTDPYTEVRYSMTEGVAIIVVEDVTMLPTAHEGADEKMVVTGWWVPEAGFGVRSDGELIPCEHSPAESPLDYCYCPCMDCVGEGRTLTSRSSWDSDETHDISLLMQADRMTWTGKRLTLHHGDLLAVPGWIMSTAPYGGEPEWVNYREYRFLPHSAWRWSCRMAENRYHEDRAIAD